MNLIKPCFPVGRLHENIAQAFVKAWEIEPEEGIPILISEYTMSDVSDEEYDAMSNAEKYRHQFLRDQSIRYKLVENYISPNHYIHPKHWYRKQEGRPRITYSGHQEEDPECGMGYFVAIDEYHRRIKARRIKKIKKRFPIVASGIAVLSGIATIGVALHGINGTIGRDRSVIS